ncbi:5-oxoprolinase subunit PxpB [Salimicrobium halophilum]|uniref:Inhibitor of KinA n=1 Tax=Salimicrobium halophilum TaxID=86666 RepID=A0A1G8UDD9_9BACI|nr:5-oxoprolinase subunit PxpB [Salimicrobium halophilum]SDJ51205.1 inhibitor of KinA [Salimicrobium halophilum]
MKHIIEPLGDQSLFIIVGEEISPDIHHRVQAIVEEMDATWITEMVPSYTGVAVYYDAMQLRKTYPHSSPYERAAAYVSACIDSIAGREASSGRTIDIPVCYGGDDFGPDLPAVAEHNGLTEDEVIEKHTSREYLVYMLGFAPGFPFLGGMDGEIAMPRKEEPRLKIPAGSVGIAGSQTGVYPLETPGGWQLIGRTPLSLFLPEKTPPSYLQPGDKVRFFSVTREAYEQWEEEE